ncbi:hypothetical protein D6D12_01465 [Aureobasidium pullulans]|uniref:RING-type E3 ubiquitin transferase n=1 Tax=Aureobasidium pullulans TaxID=5580 RepID=A0AB74K3G3_AURPU|nr:hypothetical protein D6D12_01465 [Aureobasidium pullulans]THX66012.1 hypothetical protein D6D11_00063 [Aureobasidium pullulans]
MSTSRRSSSTPDIMNDPQFDPTPASDKSPAEGDTCRICRSEGSDAEPLFYPCKCSGSIKFVHQDCLMEWLSHSNKKHCELCKTPFRFTKLYDSHMPHTLPLPIFVKRACLHTANYLLTWARAVTVALVWLVVLPWFIRWSWRGLFWVLDAGWARDPWLARMSPAAQQANASTPTADSIDEKEPFGLSLSRFLLGALFYPLKPLGPPGSYSSTNTTLETSIASPYSSLLSDVKAVNSLTSHAWVNRFILDMLEGEIITILVVIAFILVFLIREWVVQQQPIINAAAHIRDAELQLDAAERAARNLQDFQDEERRPHVDRYTHLFEEPSDSEASGDESTHFIGWHKMEEVMDTAGIPYRFGGEDHDDFMERFQYVGELLLGQLKLAEDSGILPTEIAENIWAILDNLSPTRRDLWRGILLREGPTRTMLLSNLPQDKLALSDDENVGGPAATDSETQEDSDDETLQESQRRPNMPPRDASSHAQRVLQSIEEPSNNPENTSRLLDVEADGDSSRGSWQFVSSASDAESPSTTRTPLSSSSQAGEPADAQETATVDADALGQSTGARSDETNTRSRETSINGDLSQSPSETTAQNVDEEASAVAEPATESPSEDQTSSQQASTLQATLNPEQHKGPITRLFDWFWADIVLDDEDNEPLPGVADEEIARNEAVEPPFVHLHDEEHVHDHDHDHEGAQDPEVLQAAAEAGLDAEAIEDAEDLEGILELIGMQGPLIGLGQTAMFCAVLITTTLWTAIGVPYLFGKIALLFLGDPITSMIMTPLRFVSGFADAVVDITVYAGGAATYFGSEILTRLLSMLFGSVCRKFSLSYVEPLAKRAHHAANGASGRLVDLLGGDGPMEFGLLMKSIQARQSLLSMKAEVAQVIGFFAKCLSGASYHLQKSTAPELLQILNEIAASCFRQAASSYAWVRTVLREGFSEAINDGTFTFTVKSDDSLLDPSLAVWTSADRCLTVLAGYVLLAMIGAMYLLRKESLFSSPGLQNVEKSFADLLKQAGGVLKVILIISIEMLAFPLYCGMLLDCALLPLFENASIASRLAFAERSPWLFVFMHWFIGTCYMFHFALFVSMCRRILRSGVLYFIRDPDDPTFHPVRDVLERSVTTQLRKIAFSGLVYGGLVIVCLGGAIWGTARFGVFPVRWARPEANLEFPIDFLGYNLLAPVVASYLFPSKGMETFFGTWLKLCARSLRLSQFLFGERRKIEEGYSNDESWITRFNPWKDQDAIINSGSFVYDGKYVRAPATDQVRIPRGERVFLEVSDADERIDGTNPGNGIHGRQPDNFNKVYIPPWFRLRIFTFISCLWMFAIAMGFGVTVVPMIFGRLILSMAVSDRIAPNDLYAFAVGITTLGIALQAIFNGRQGLKSTQENISKQNLAAVSAIIKKQTWRLIRSAYVYGFAVIIVPTLFALVLELYLILPLRTYMGPAVLAQEGGDVALNDLSGAQVSLANTTVTAFTGAQFSQSMVAPHTFNILQDWTLGFIYGRVVLRLLLLSRTSRPAAALRMITRDGFTNPNVKLATRAFVLPTLLLFSIVLFCPPLIASVLDLTDIVSESIRTKVYRYSYPICASQVLGLWCTWELAEGMRRWRGRIKDEVYLIGERLHNFGERRPPEGSKSVVRRQS